MKIGVFDSGMGGLIVSQELQKAFPEVEFVFVADSGNFPYGTKSDEELQVAITAIIDTLEQMSADIIIAACNTASSIIERYDLKGGRAQLITIINPTIDYAIENSKWEKYLVLATTSTVESQSYGEKLRARSQLFVEYDSQALVSLVESGRYGYHDANEVLRDHFGAFLGDDHFNIILGCTHFILLEEKIAALFPNSLTVSPIRPLQQMLRSILDPSPHRAKHKQLEVYTTGDPDSFAASVERLMDDTEVKKLHLHRSPALAQGRST